MIAAWASLLNGDGFMPHGHCYLWNPTLIWLHVVADGLTGLAYVSIPFTLLSFARQRRDFPFTWMLLWFGGFIIACGATHFLEIYTLWWPAYWLSGSVKVVTAVASVGTAILLARLVPSALALPSPAQLLAVETERHLAQDWLQRLIDSVQDYAIYSVDAGGQVRSWNPGAERLQGYPGPEALGQPESQFFSPELRAAGQPDLSRQEALRDGRSVSEGYRRRRDGSLFWAHNSVFPVRAAGGALLGFAVVCRDLTRDRKAEEGLRRVHRELEETSLKLQISNRELEAFSYSVAHDLRAPLRGMHGFAQVLVEDHRQLLDSGGREAVDEIQLNARRMAQLIDSLLSLSRTTRAELKPVPVDLGLLAREAAAHWFAAGEMPSTDPARVELLVAPKLTAHADPNLARILIENLVGNALKFCSKVARPRVEVGVELQDGQRVFFVRDNGAGLDMAYAHKLFAPFQRLHTSSAFPGTGIGLAIAQRIVTRHGGRLWADGRPAPEGAPPPGAGRPPTANGGGASGEATLYFTLLEGGT